MRTYGYLQGNVFYYLNDLEGEALGEIPKSHYDDLKREDLYLIDDILQILFNLKTSLSS